VAPSGRGKRGYLMKEKNLLTDQGETVFSFFLNKEESIGLAVTESGRSYFLIDSGDYWYDLIQQRYPRELRCKCKSRLFTAKCRFFQRHDRPEFDQIDLITTCTSCGTEKTQLAFSLKYSPTEQLYETPLVFCPKPKIRYKTSEITSFWTSADAGHFVKLLSSLQLKITVWHFNDLQRVLSEVDPDEALQIVEAKKYLSVYFSSQTPKLNVLEDDKGVYVSEDPWRRQELIQLSSPTNMHYDRERIGFLYYTRFCNEFIEDYEVKSKSREFEELTKKISTWLKNTYYSGRGRHCVDNKSECVRLFGDRFGT
jgi:hypothetical protein